MKSLLTRAPWLLYQSAWEPPADQSSGGGGVAEPDANAVEGGRITEPYCSGGTTGGL